MTYHDIEAVDPDYYKNLKWMLEVSGSMKWVNLILHKDLWLSHLISLAHLSLQNDVSDIPDLTFSMDADEEKHILYEKTEVYVYLLLI